MSKSLKYIAAGLILTIQLVDDQTEEVLRTLSINANDVPDNLRDGEDENNVKLYGIRKLCQERSSSEKDPETKFDSMLDTAEVLKSGLWKSDEVRTRAPQIDPVFAQAVANVRGKPLGKIVVSLDRFCKATTILPLGKIVVALQNLSKEQRDAMRKHPEVVAQMEALKADIAAESDSDALGDLL